MSEKSETGISEEEAARHASKMAKKKAARDRMMKPTRTVKRG